MDMTLKCLIVLDLKDLVVQIKYRYKRKTIDVCNVPKRICSMHDLLDYLALNFKKSTHVKLPLFSVSVRYAFNTFLLFMWSQYSKLVLYFLWPFLMLTPFVPLLNLLSDLQEHLVRYQDALEVAMRLCAVHAIIHLRFFLYLHCRPNVLLHAKWILMEWFLISVSKSGDFAWKRPAGKLMARLKFLLKPLFWPEYFYLLPACFTLPFYLMLYGGKFPNKLVKS